MKKVVKISESKLRQMISEAVMEAVNGGWEVEDNEAEAAYNLAVEKLGKEVIDDAIIRAMSSHVLAELLAYIFRQYDFREWDEYKSSKSEEPEIYEGKNRG
jgi:myo-inositol-1-phosphate synthase